MYVAKIPQWRITLLPGVLLAARNMAILAAGEDKKEALKSSSTVRMPRMITLRRSWRGRRENRSSFSIKRQAPQSPKSDPSCHWPHYTEPRLRFSTLWLDVLYFPDRTMKLVPRITATLASRVCMFAAVPQRHLVPARPQMLVDSNVRMPVSFEPNRGQAPPNVRWLSRTPGRTFLLTGTEALMMLGPDDQASTIRMKIVGAKAQPETEGVERLDSTSNYFIGNKPAEWQTAVPHYARVRYKEIYPGIDVVYYGSDRHLEYDFVLAPGADPGIIELAYEGADRMRSRTMAISSFRSTVVRLGSFDPRSIRF